MLRQARAECAPTKHLEVLILPLECSLTLALSLEFNKAIKTTLALYRPLFSRGGTVAGVKPSSVFAFQFGCSPQVPSTHIGASDRNLQHRSPSI